MAKHIDLTKHPIGVQLAAHAIGLDHKRPYIRHGRRFYKPYRNYFVTSVQSKDRYPWTQLVSEGSARFRSDGEKVTFWLTRQGLNWLGHQLGVTIHDEEE